MKSSSFLRNPFLKKMAMICTVGFSILSLVSATVAWFCANTRAKSGGGKSRAYHDDIHAVWKLAQFNPDTLKGTDVDEEGRPFDITSGSFTFLSYDTIFTERNKYTPSLLRVGITGDNISRNSGTVRLSIFHDTSKDSIDPNEQGLSKYFTSAMRFQFGTGEGTIRHNSTVNMFGDAVKYFRGQMEDPDDDSSYLVPPTKKTFITNEVPPFVKSEVLEIEASFTRSDWIPYGSDSDILYLYLYIDYDETLVTYFSQASISEQGLEGNTVNLLNDLTYIAVTYSNN